MRSNHGDEYTVRELNPVEWKFDDCPKARLWLLFIFLAVCIVQAMLIFIQPFNELHCMNRLVPVMR